MSLDDEAKDLVVEAIDGRGGSHQTGKALSEPPAVCTKLETLNLKGTYQGYVPSQFGDSAGLRSWHALFEKRGACLTGLVGYAMSANPLLHTLALGWHSEFDECEPGGFSHPVQVTLKGLASLDSVSQSLVNLDAGGCSFLCHEDIQPILQSAGGLERLNLNGARVLADLAFLGMRSVQLRHLILRANVRISDVGIVSNVLTNSPNLELLNVGCTKLTDATLRGIIRHCPRLKSLDVCFNRNMTVAGLRAAAEGLPQLVDFGFSGFELLTIPDLKHILSCNAPKTKIGIAACKDLTDDALDIILQLCPTIERLFAAYSAFTTAGIQAFVQRACGSLQQLCVRDSEAVDEAVVADIQKRFGYVFDI
ncbi:hypothetical protein CYMTET_13414 [Cymbomonas tetramitiformis]|uniref:Uncharacterized protein n=1 Tax=Cymbomonas tetramitiformis TaxID=36881 RepID=A0AAE0GJP5_9CHLO|nr:hypothetical protein CYMTET_13414 [Cymbomonas tetramitiformis]